MGKLIILYIAFVSLTGCSILGGSKGPRDAYDYDQSKSYALNVMTAASRADRLHDIPKPEHFTDIDPNSKNFQEAFDTAFLGLAWSSLSALNAGVAILNFGSSSKPKDFPQVFAWVPSTDAKKETEAEKLVENKVITAVRDVFINKGYIAKEDAYPRRYFYLGKHCTGQITDDFKTKCITNVFGSSWSKGARVSTKYMVKAKIPSFVGVSSRGFFTESTIPNGYIEVGIHGFPKGSINITKTYLQLSKKLPKWVYMYLPQRKSRTNKEGYPNLPILINQGKIHYFFKPEQ